MESVLEMAKVTSKGQITVPVSIRRLLGLHPGGKVMFVEKEDGSIAIRNASLGALSEARASFAGAAAEAGLSTEQDVVDLVKETRRARGNR